MEFNIGDVVRDSLGRKGVVIDHSPEVRDDDGLEYGLYEVKMDGSGAAFGNELLLGSELEPLPEVH